MKKLLSILAALALGLSFAACDFGEDEGDATDEQYDTVDPGETADPIDTTDVPDVRYQYVRIKDDPENITINGCSTNPGADIDAVELYRGAAVEELTDDHLVATVEEVMSLDGETLCPENHKNDETTVEGPADGIVDPDAGTYSGYFSLNGQEMTVLLSDNEELTDGDVLRIIEMYNPDNPDSTVEKYSVVIGFFDAEVDDYAWSEIIADGATGEVFLDIAIEY